MRLKFNNPNLKPTRQELRNKMTQAEVLLWGKIRDKKLLGYKFRRQYSVGPFILDFYCPKLKLAIELDGSQHAQEEQERYDEGRTNYLNDRDIIVIRYWNNEIIEDIENVYLDIINKIEDLK